jgi:hypothetical protein
MSSSREPATAQSNSSRVSVGQFAERFRAEAIPLSNNFSYFCSSVPMSEEVLKEYLEEPIAALPPKIAAMLPRISILLVPYLERTANGKLRGAAKLALEKQISDFVVSERPAEGHISWVSQVSFETETVLVFALKEHDVAEYHYRLFRHLAALVADHWEPDASSKYLALLREELNTAVHGEVDEESWQAKQVLLRRQTSVKKETVAFVTYARLSFIDTLTLFLHGICCDIDVETGPRQLPSRYLRKRLNLLRSLYPPPGGYAVFPEEMDADPKKVPAPA